MFIFTKIPHVLDKIVILKTLLGVADKADLRLLTDNQCITTDTPTLWMTKVNHASIMKLRHSGNIVSKKRMFHC